MALLVFFHVLCCQGSLLPTWAGKMWKEKKKKELGSSYYAITFPLFEELLILAMM